MSADGDRLARALAHRFTPPETPDPPAPAPEQKWEDRHVRWTIWIDRDLRSDVLGVAEYLGLSRRQVIDDMARAWLEQFKVAPTPPAPSTVDRTRSR